MDFGQITDLSQLEQIRWALPPAESTEEQLQLERLARAAARAPGETQIRVGPPIWSHSPWVGYWYPPEATGADFLKEYSKQFLTVEVNSTFYAIPSAETFQKWKSAVGPHFRFCPKFPKSISHTLNGDHPDLQLFCERVALLEDRVGVCFLQLPAHVGPDQRLRIEALLAKIPRKLKTVIELRHSGFFEGQRLKAEWVELLAKHFIGTVCVDTPGERSIVHTSLSSTRVMIRFLGANLHASNEERFRQWADRIALWEKSGIKEVYFLVHEPDNTHAPEATVQMVDALNARLKVPLKKPEAYALL